MPFVIDKTKDPLYKEAKEEWFERGQLEEKRAIARSMLLNNLPLETIIKVTNLSKEEIEKLS